MKISFIIPAYNTEQYIVRCLESIPKRDDIEIIVVNDCSIDGTREVIKEYIKGKKNITFIDLEKNVGVAEARNKAIDIAKGEYLYFIDSDDYLLEDINKLIDDLKGDVIYFGLEFNDGRVLFKREKNGVLRCVRRKFLGELRYPNLRHGEDVELYKKVMLMNPQKNFTNYLIWHYNYPRIDSLCYRHEHRLPLEDKIKLTIIVPVYNNENNIERCLNSIDLYGEIEVIIIDDYSTDKSVKIIEKWLKKQTFKNIRFLKNDKNYGVGYTVQKGYDNMNGEYALTLCDDDYLYKEKLRPFIKELTGEDLIYYDMKINSGTIWKGKTNPGSTKAYKKTIIGDTRRKNQNFGGDKVFYNEILAKNPTMKETNILLYHYNYPRKNSLMDKWRQTYKDFDITVYTEVHNGYGVYLKDWLENINKQRIKPKEVIIVLGKDHKADLKELKLDSIKLTILNSKSDNMGVLRNEAIKQITTEWQLYFSADDKLLPNAIEEIQNKSCICDGVLLRYIEKPRNKIRKSAFITMYNIKKWKDNCLPGYIATKRKIDGEVMFYEESETPPNYPFLFKLAYKDAIIYHSNTPLAVYRKRNDSHGLISMKNNMFADVYEKYINERAVYYLELYDVENKKRDNVMVLVLHTFNGFREGYKFIAGRKYKMSRKRAEELSGKTNQAKRVLVKTIK